MPGPEALNMPGRRDGQTKMIKDGNTISVHSWNEAEAQWKKVGDVVGQPKSKDSSGRGKDGGKVMYEGVEYDHVFHIDIDEGVVLKLPYNIGQDPFQVAQDFIHKHQLVRMDYCFYDSQGQSLMQHLQFMFVTQQLKCFQPQEYLETIANFIVKNSGGAAQFQMGESCDPLTGTVLDQVD